MRHVWKSVWAIVILCTHMHALASPNQTKKQKELDKALAQFSARWRSQSCSDSFSEDTFANWKNGSPSRTISQAQRLRLLQWLADEQVSNAERYRQNQSVVEVNVKELFLDEAQITRGSENLPRLTQGDIVFWLTHPFNEDSQEVFDRLPSVGSLQAHTTAGRSLVFLDGPLAGYSLKAAASHPHGLGRLAQEEKTEMRDDVIAGIEHSAFISRIQSSRRKLSFEHIFLQEVLSVVNPQTGQGFLIRDLSPMLINSNYLPAFSIPYVAERLGIQSTEDYISFLKKNYLKPLAELKAQLLLDFAYQMEFPHPQNLLIELDLKGKPTGRLLLRDLSDLEMVEPLAQALGLIDQIKREKAMGLSTSKIVKPYGSKSLFTLIQHPSFSLSREQVNELKKFQNKKFVEELSRILKAKNPPGLGASDQSELLTEWIIQKF